MKEYIKRFIIVFVGIIVGSGITYAAIINSSEVGYDNSNSSLSATTVQEALDELYEKSENCSKSNIVKAYTYNSSSCITGEESGCVETECYKTKTSGSCPAGTIIKYAVNDSEEKYFHVLHDDGDTITMQQRENTIANTAWYSSSNSNSSGPTTVLPVLESATASWSNVNDIEYTLGTDILYSNKYTGCSSYSSCSTNTYTLAKRSNKKARMITIQETNALGCTTSSKSCPNWMNNYLYNSTSYGGTVSDNNTYGYWTMSAYSSSSNYAWYVYFSGCVSYYYTTSTYSGARAVVEISK